ncbi:hypothetical protein [Reyranella soli]|jgi:hypothetical protein|uniref:Uncharacterized protein n=1 Tax=Reyranella soli TaxID=1230389 RepID=A0A512NPV0_9HYPH|nr:hypothetical protein [Reyranella soli]GEP60975.1 hypothetical protein RSO01_81410 [Reyranella soli]
MSIRTTETTVTFRRPFTLAALDGAQPAGTYRLVVEEEQIPGLSFIAFRRVATLLHMPADSVPGGTREVVSVLPDELAEAVAADAA